MGRNGVFEYLLFKNLWRATTHQVFAYKIGESGLSGAGRNNIFKYLLVEMLLGRHRRTQFCTEHWRIWACGGGQELYIWISSIWNDFGKAWKHQVLHIKLANLHWQWWAGIIYLNIFYLKCLWEDIKTPNFAHKIGGSWLPGVGRPNVFKYLKCFWQRIKISGFAHRSGESALAGAGRNNIVEYLLFEMLFEGIKTPHFA